ncbi:MAG: CBS domain-containing protein [Rhodobacteraceae bacterium]|nr:CBS domain-containing protein [Paracoccaceae bacterium]
MLVRQILNAKPEGNVLTLPPGTSVPDAVALLSSKKIGAVIISPDGEQALGILSERDIVRELGKRGTGCLTDTVDDLMTRNLQSCTSSSTADEVLAQMTDGRFRHLPVIEDGKMIGLISIGDVVKARLSELSMERDALADMVMGH